MIMRKRSKGERKAFTVRLEPEAMEVLDRIASKYGCSYSYAINYLILKLSKHLLSDSEKEPFPIISSIEDFSNRSFNNTGDVKEKTYKESFDVFGRVEKDSNSNNELNNIDLSKVPIRW